MVDKIIIFLTLFSLALYAEGMKHVSPGPPKHCLMGPYHKDAPSVEAGQFQECHSWMQGKSCCTVALTESISLYKALQLYNGYSWDLCSTLSPSCEGYIKVASYIINLVRQL